MNAHTHNVLPLRGHSLSRQSH